MHEGYTIETVMGVVQTANVFDAYYLFSYLVRIVLYVNAYDCLPDVYFATILFSEYAIGHKECSCYESKWAAICFVVTWLVARSILEENNQKAFLVLYVLMALSGCDKPLKTIETFKRVHEGQHLMWLVLSRSRVFAVTLVLTSGHFSAMRGLDNLVFVYMMGIAALILRLYSGHLWASLFYAMFMMIVSYIIIGFGHVLNHFVTN